MNNSTITLSCPALFLSATCSGEGKTTFTAALARYFRNQGKEVRLFKTGPDYLDPQILTQASGYDVEQLDIWMAGEDYCRQKLFEAAKTADIILVEGVMGMFDGSPSSADLAALFNIPVAVLINVKGMAQTVAALAAGMANFRNDVQVAGLIVNRCSTERHAQLIREALPPDIPLLATLEYNPEISLPERHLGLVQAQEVYEQLEQCFNAGAKWLAGNQITDMPAPVKFHSVKLPKIKPLLQGKTIAIAKDKAFSFIYTANLELLQAMGANYYFFSPLKDEQLPEVDALWLPGGYPELYVKELFKNKKIRNEIKEFYLSNKPILAECGGFLYCLEQLTDFENKTYDMLGLLEGQGAMSGKRGCQGMQTAMLPEGEVRGHSHHRSRVENMAEPIGYATHQHSEITGEAIYRQRKLTASYIHLFFASNPPAIAALFRGTTLGASEQEN